MDRNRERACWILLVVITAACCTLAGTGREQKQAAENPSERSKESRPAGERRTGRASHERSDDETRKLANHALSTPRRTERFQRLMSLLDETTPENWNLLWKEYIRQTLEEGRIHETEWSLFMGRVGEVAGPDAMAYFSANGQQNYNFNRREVLKGWAAVDPRAALAWLEGQPQENQPAEFWGAVMSGAAASDSKLATELLVRVPAEVSPGVIRNTAETLIQSEGLGNTIRLLDEMVNTIPEGQPMPAHLSHFYMALKQRADRIAWLAGSYPDMKVRQPSVDHLEARFAGGARRELPEE
jgi:hypothetical protein